MEIDAKKDRQGHCCSTPAANCNTVSICRASPPSGFEAKELSTRRSRPLSEGSAIRTAIGGGGGSGVHAVL